VIARKRETTRIPTIRRVNERELAAYLIEAKLRIEIFGEEKLVMGR
jgi:hypothetical protein